MPISLGLIMPILVSSIALLIMIPMFSAVSDAVNCNGLNATIAEQCNQAKKVSWSIMGVMPVGLFFLLFAMFGGSNVLGGLINKITGSKKQKQLHIKKDKPKNILTTILQVFGLIRGK